MFFPLQWLLGGETKNNFSPMVADPQLFQARSPPSPCSSARAGGGWLTSECLAPGSPHSCLKHRSLISRKSGEKSTEKSTGKPMEFAMELPTKIYSLQVTPGLLDDDANLVMQLFP